MDQEAEYIRKTVDGESCSNAFHTLGQDRPARAAITSVANCVLMPLVAIRSVTGQPPRGWYYGMVQSKAGVRSRALVVKTFKELGLPLKYYSDDYSDDLPHWVALPGSDGSEGLLVVPYA